MSFSAWAQGGSTFVRISAAASHPFNLLAQLAPVRLQITAQLTKVTGCDSLDRRMIAVHAQMVTTEFPDFDVLYRLGGGKWVPLAYRKSPFEHPVLGLPMPPNGFASWGSRTDAMIVEGCCDDS